MNSADHDIEDSRGEAELAEFRLIVGEARLRQGESLETLPPPVRDTQRLELTGRRPRASNAGTREHEDRR